MIHLCLFVHACLVTQSCLGLWNPMDCSLSGSSVHGGTPGKNTGVGCHTLLQGISPTQGSKPGLPHCRQILYQLSHQGSPFVYKSHFFSPWHVKTHVTELLVPSACGLWLKHGDLLASTCLGYLQHPTLIGEASLCGSCKSRSDCSFPLGLLISVQPMRWQTFPP